MTATASRHERSGNIITAGSTGRLLLRGGTVLTMDPDLGTLTSGDVLIDRGRIASVSPRLSDVPADAVVVDVSGSIVMPGFVDGHRHCWQGVLRRLAPDADLPHYLAITHDGVARHYRPEDMYIGNLVALLGALNSGFTTVMDLSHNTRSKAHADAVFQSYREADIRAVHASAPPNAGDWEEHWPEDLSRLAQTSEDEDLITLRMAIDLRRVRPATELMTLARSMGLGIHMDGVMGAASTVEIAQLGRSGFLGPDVSIVHATALGDSAWEEIARTRTRIVLATTSDEQLALAGGVPPIQRVLDADILPALSVDVEISLAGDMFTQMRTTLTTQRMLAAGAKPAGGIRPLTNADVLAMATRGGAEASGLGDVVGSLTVGRAADLVVVAADGIDSLPGGNPVGTIVQGTDRSHIRGVFVAGVARKWDGELIGVDTDALRAMAVDSRDYLLGRAGFSLDVNGLSGVPQLHDEGLQQFLGGQDA